MAKYDWGTISKEYIEGITDDDGVITYPSYQDLATRHDGNERTIRTRGGKESWSQKRDIYKSRLSQAISDKKVEEISSRAVEFDSLALDLSTKALKIILIKLDDPDIKPSTLNEYKTAGLGYQKMGRIALGLSVEKTEHEEKGGKPDGLKVLPIPEDPILRGEVSDVLSGILSGSAQP